MKKLLCLALLLSAGSVYTGSVSASNQPAGKKSGNNSKDIYKKDLDRLQQERCKGCI